MYLQVVGVDKLFTLLCQKTQKPGCSDDCVFKQLFMTALKTKMGLFVPSTGNIPNMILVLSVGDSKPAKYCLITPFTSQHCF